MRGVQVQVLMGPARPTYFGGVATGVAAIGSRRCRVGVGDFNAGASKRDTSILLGLLHVGFQAIGIHPSNGRLQM